LEIHAQEGDLKFRVKDIQHIDYYIMAVNNFLSFSVERLVDIEYMSVE
jgi:hypothetical protein